LRHAGQAAIDFSRKCGDKPGAGVPIYLLSTMAVPKGGESGGAIERGRGEMPVAIFSARPYSGGDATTRKLA
jgi:hypothetical protein